jgi:hypothetical protein
MLISIAALKVNIIKILKVLDSNVSASVENRLRRSLKCITRISKVG